ncbi:MAG: ABC transporter permease [Thermoplasmata archaeon]|nr:ABC transporter permease [Thermoplasmata archaeon]TFG71023.1 MAG: ABC transporter permease [Methanomassiliicoccus sp.]
MAGMARYVIARSIQTFITLLIILTLIFIMFESLPAKPQDLLRTSPAIQQSQIDYMTSLYGYDRPVHERYAMYMVNMLTFDFGISFSRAIEVSSILEERIPKTLLLFGGATILAYVIGIYLGALIAWRRGGALDGGTVVVSLVFYNMPSFWIGLIFLVIFASQLDWFPLTGWYDATDSMPFFESGTLGFKILDIGWHLFLPMLVLLLLSLAGTILLMRTAMLDVIGENYMITAKAIGLPERKVLFKHGTRNAMLPVVTSFIIAFVFAIGGAVVLENVFSFPGMGQLYIQSLNQLDFPVAEATLYIITLMVLLGNFVADLLYGYLDPRVRV